MRILFVADAGSAIAQNWIRRVIDAGNEVHVVSTYPIAENVRGAASTQVVPVAFSSISRPAASANGTTKNSRTRFASTLRKLPVVPMLTRARHWLGPLDVLRRAPRLRRLIEDAKPDFVHALRLPFEGFLAAEALRGLDVPLLVSVWGNDFTLHAARLQPLRYLTRRALHRADAIHLDCHRDLRLAHEYGFRKSKAALVAPGCGGIRTDVFHPGETSGPLRQQWNIPPDAEIVLNPRGVRSYVRRDVFFKAIPEIHRRRPNAVFLALGNAGDPESERWVKRLRLSSHTRLLPAVPHDAMADLFRSAAITVSPSTHDGTPNTLLEAMACGSFPIAGDIESVREWIEPGINGLLFAPTSPAEFAAASVRALTEPELRGSAFTANQHLIREKASQGPVFARIERFYADVVATRGATP